MKKPKRISRDITKTKVSKVATFTGHCIQKASPFTRTFSSFSWLENKEKFNSAFTFGIDKVGQDFPDFWSFIFHGNSGIFLEFPFFQCSDFFLSYLKSCFRYFSRNQKCKKS